MRYTDSLSTVRGARPGRPGIKYHVRVSQMGVASPQRSSDQLSSQIDDTPHVVQIMRLASSSTTRCEGDLACGKSTEEAGRDHVP